MAEGPSAFGDQQDAGGSDAAWFYSLAESRRPKADGK
jgi:hypothetical protein